MSIQGEGLTFKPLYWVYHDQWENYVRPQQGPDSVSQHYGHVHLFMPGFPADGSLADAFSGRMSFRFTLKDIWGPRSDDPNQTSKYEVIGTPRWTFTVSEVWRRMYIQPWDATGDGVAVPLRRGIRWDASAPDSDHGPLHGPFREGRDAATGRVFTPLYLEHARTLPIEYFDNDDLSQAERGNVVAVRAEQYTQQLAELMATFPDETRLAPEIFDELWEPRKYALDEHPGMNYYLPAGGYQVTPHPAAVPGFSDALYIWPLIEYQTVEPIKDRGLPGNSANDVSNPYDVTEDFGDGWSIEVTLPLDDPETDEYRSPFGPHAGVCRPIGEYFNQDYDGNPLVPDEKKARYAEHPSYDPRPHEEGYDPEHPGDNFYDPPFDPDPALSGQLLTFHDPYEAGDGFWVQQCLGGKVEAQAKICVEHKLGGRRFITTTSTQYLPATPFAGASQLQAAST